MPDGWARLVGLVTGRRGAAAFGAATAALYLRFPSASYNFDGIACAIAVESGDMKHLVHGNHLAYGVLAYAWYSLWRLFGYSGQAIQCLQVLNSLIGAAAAAVFCAALLRQKIAPALSLIAAAGLAVSSLYWKWSLEAQVYPLGAVFLFCAFFEAASNNPKAARLGAWHAGAVLGHVGNTMFLPAAVWSLEIRGRDGLRKFALYLAALAGVVAAAYAAAGFLWVNPGSMQELRVWLLGSAALGVDRKFAWVGGYSAIGFLEWGRNALRLFGGGWPVGAAAWLLAGIGACVSNRRRLVVLCLLWLGGYAVLFSCWHPGQSVYRITDLAPLWLLAVLGLESATRRFPRFSPALTAVAAACVVALGASNLVHEILPAADPGRNADLQRSLWIARETPENAWIIVDGIDQVYVPYFARRKPLNLRYAGGRPEALRERVDRCIQAGEPVFAVPSSLPPEWREWLKSQPIDEIARRGDEALDRVR